MSTPASHLALIAAGGACGALLRHIVSTGVAAVAGRAFPWGTLCVNLLGSLAIGVLYVVLTERVLAAAGWRALLVTGLLGALTTFSTFSVETLQLVEGGHGARALLNVGANVLLCLAACWAGAAFARQF